MRVTGVIDGAWDCHRREWAPMLWLEVTGDMEVMKLGWKIDIAGNWARILRD